MAGFWVSTDFIAPTAREIIRGMGAVVPVEVRGIPYTCWKCHRQSMAVTSVRLHSGDGKGDWFSTLDGNELGLRYAKDLLAMAQNPLSESIKVRWSKTLGRRYLSNGCDFCDALFGDFYLNDELDETEGELILFAERPVLEWLAMVSSSKPPVFNLRIS